MGEQDRTANSHMWMILGLVFMFGYLLLEPWLPESNFEDFYFLGSYTLFYAAWVIFDGWAQVPFVRDRYGDNYPPLGQTDYARCRRAGSVDDDVFNLRDCRHHFIP